MRGGSAWSLGVRWRLQAALNKGGHVGGCAGRAYRPGFPRVRRTRGEEGDLGGKRWAGRLQCVRLRGGRAPGWARVARVIGDFAEH